MKYTFNLTITNEDTGQDILRLWQTTTSKNLESYLKSIKKDLNSILKEKIKDLEEPKRSKG